MAEDPDKPLTMTDFVREISLHMDSCEAGYRAFQAMTTEIERIQLERQKLAKHCVVVIPSGDYKNVWCTVCQARRVLRIEVTLDDFHQFDCLVLKVEKGD